MPPTHMAFPVLDPHNIPKTYLAEIVQDSLHRVRDAICRRAGGSWRGGASIPSDGLRCTYHVGSGVAVPLTFLGTTAGFGKDYVLTHSPGLPGAFPVPIEYLDRLRGVLTADDCGNGVLLSAETVAMGRLCLIESVRSGLPEKNGFLSLYSNCRRRHFSLQGNVRLLEVGSQINEEALDLSFPYHCGGEHAEKRYLDITQEACNLFGSYCSHGAKLLSRYGLAVCVGVAPREDNLGVPCILWHPNGSAAACPAPVMHGCHTLTVGAAPLEYNGPTSSSELLTEEDPLRYMNSSDTVSDLDTTKWLTMGLFGVQPGDAWAGPVPGAQGPFSVHGVGYNVVLKEFELYVCDSTSGSLFPVADV